MGDLVIEDEIKNSEIVDAKPFDYKKYVNMEYPHPFTVTKATKKDPRNGSTRNLRIAAGRYRTNKEQEEYIQDALDLNCHNVIIINKKHAFIEACFFLFPIL